ncbi:hypothetical protein ACI0FM_07845 [Paenochrobactrum sp. BZR 588]|uniref:hypothetical protein n=1 Tax=unclassified Paenochrobactrum TaxID=2639760 RepID=UPI0038538911
MIAYDPKVNEAAHWVATTRHAYGTPLVTVIRERFDLTGKDAVLALTIARRLKVED